MFRQVYTFRDTVEDFQDYCTNLEQDLGLEEDLPDNRSVDNVLMFLTLPYLKEIY